MLVPVLLGVVGLGALLLGKSAPKSYPAPIPVPDPNQPQPQPQPQPQQPNLPYDPGLYKGANADPWQGPVVPIDYKPDSPPSDILPGQEQRLRERPIYY